MTMLIKQAPELTRRRPTAKELAEEKHAARDWITRLHRTINDLTEKLKHTRSPRDRGWYEYLIEAAWEKIEELKGELKIMCGRNPTIPVYPADVPEPDEAIE